MEDTSRESRELIRSIVMSKPVEERFLMCATMYEDAKELARVDVPDGLSYRQQEALVFKRLHRVSPAELVLTKYSEEDPF
jgi:hypothetical protein